METTELLIKVLSKAASTKEVDFVSLHSMCRQDVAEKRWSYFVMLNDITYIVLTAAEFEVLSTCFGEPCVQRFGTTVSSSVEHLQLILDFEVI